VNKAPDFKITFDDPPAPWRSPEHVGPLRLATPLKPQDRKERRRMRAILHKAATNGSRAVRKADRDWYEANRIRLMYGSVENYRNGAVAGALIHVNKRTPWPYRMEA
jgi:hypothetical protein